MTYQINFRAMGTSIQVDLDCDPGQAEVLRSIPGWFETWEQHFSRFKSESELSRLNRSSGMPFRVSAFFWEMIQYSLAVERETDGWLTSTVLSALEVAGYNRSFDTLADGSPDTNEGAFLPTGSSAEILLDDRFRTVTLPHGLGLDFGGFAKGWAVDQTMRRLRTFGPTLVDGGGDIAVSGPLPDAQPWPIDIEHPRNPDEALGRIHLYSGGLATSGRYRRKWKKNGVWQHHLIDPFTARPSESDLLTCTVLAPDVMRAETAAKRIFFMGSGPGLAWAEEQSDLAALLYLENDEVFTTSRFTEMKERQPWL